MQSQELGGLLVIAIALYIGIENGVALGLPDGVMVLGFGIAGGRFKQGFRQILRQHQFRYTQDDRAFHRVFEFTNVTRPGILRDHLLRLGRQALEIEELALQLLNDVLTDVDGEHTERRRHRSDTLQLQRRWTENVKLLIAERPEAKFSLPEIARKVHCSPFHLSRIFRATVGSSIHQYQLRLRLALALDQLGDGSQSLTELALALGFSSHSHFTAAFQQAFGFSPSDFRRIRTARHMRKLSKILKA